MPRFFFLGLGFGLLATSAALGQSTLSGSVFVIEDDRRVPVEGAYVIATADDRKLAAARTDLSGAYELPGLPGRALTFTVEHRGHFTREAGGAPTQSFVRTCPAEGSCGEADFLLDKASVIEGYLLGPFGDPIYGPDVHLEVTKQPERGGRGSGQIIYTDDRGYFRVYGLAAGEYTVTAIAGGLLRSVYQSLAADVTLGAGETATPIYLTMTPTPDPVEVSVVVEGLDLVGDESASVLVWDLNSREGSPRTYSLQLEVSDEGLPRFSGAIPPGHYEFLATVREPEQRTRRMPMGIRHLDGGSASLHFTAGWGATFAGQVRYEDLAPQHVDLSLVRIDTDSTRRLQVSRPPRRERIDRFSLGGILPGRYRLETRALDYFIASETEFQLSEGQRVDTEVIVSGNFAEVSGVVRPPAGAAGAAGPFLVALRGPGDDVRVTQTDEQGRYAFAGLRPGDYELCSWSDPATPAQQQSVWGESERAVRRFPLAAGDRTEVLLTAQP